MRVSALFGRTARQAPAEAELPGQRLLLRAGMVRRLASGVYTYLPLGLRALRRVEAIVRREMATAGYQELLMPLLQPRELWEASGRWAGIGDELFRLRDRAGRDFSLAFTNEELISQTVAAEVRSYRQLPVRVYHIQRKFRDEPRPRGGLIRLREFTMKDAYSFDGDQAALEVSYAGMLAAYHAIFARCDLEVVAAAADSGVMGGALSHELVAESPHGEDTLVRCDGCGYAANQEAAAEAAPPDAASAGELDAPEDIATPGVTTIPDLARFLDLPPGALLKTMLYAGSGGLVAALVPGDREVGLEKLRRAAGQGELRPAAAAEIAAAGGVPGYLGPQGLHAHLLADRSVAAGRAYVAGANRPDTHRRGLVVGRDYVAESADLALAEAGRPCPRCGRPLRLARAIELGHLFQLGTRYTAAYGARYLDERGRERELLECSYGIGLDRTLAAIAEQHHDERGLCWPRAVAPFDIALCALGLERPGLREAAERLERELEGAGYTVLYDDREESAGVKFADADLIGLPLRVTLGPRTLARGDAELKRRRAAEAEAVELGRVVARAGELLGGPLPGLLGAAP